MRADPDAIDGAPHFFEAELSDEPARRFAEPHQMNREERRRQQIFIDADARHRDVVDEHRRGPGDLDARLADPARGEGGAAFVEQADLAEFADLQHVVLQDAVLLCGREAGILQVCGERLQQLGVRRDIAADLFSRARRDVFVALDDFLPGAALQRQDRDDAVRHEGSHGRQRQEEGEADGDVANEAAHVSWCARPVVWPTAARDGCCSGRPGLFRAWARQNAG